MFPMHIEWNAKETNMETLEDVIKRVHPEADLLILPETFSTGFPSGEDKEAVRSLAERNTGETIDRLKKLADRHFSRGYHRMSVRYRGWNLALVACYDIRFPVWCRNVLNEYDALIAVANWPSVRVGAWNTLLPARAIENEAYVCGVNCKGRDPKGFEYDGSSAAYDFRGKNITVDGPVDGLLYATLSRERLDADPFKLL